MSQKNNSAKFSLLKKNIIVESKIELWDLNIIVQLLQLRILGSWQFQSLISSSLCTQWWHKKSRHLCRRLNTFLVSRTSKLKNYKLWSCLWLRKRNQEGHLSTNKGSLLNQFTCWLKDKLNLQKIAIFSWKTLTISQLTVSNFLTLKALRYYQQDKDLDTKFNKTKKKEKKPLFLMRIFLWCTIFIRWEKTFKFAEWKHFVCLGSRNTFKARKEIQMHTATPSRLRTMRYRLKEFRKFWERRLCQLSLMGSAKLQRIKSWRDNKTLQMQSI